MMPEKLLGDIALHGNQFFGWSAQRNNSAPIRINIAIGNIWSARLVADRERLDLKLAGIGEGRHGFCIEVPKNILDGKEHTVTISSEDVSGQELRFEMQLDYAPAYMKIEEWGAKSIRGWVSESTIQSPKNIQLLSDQNVIDHFFARGERPDLTAAGQVGAKEFTLRLPLSTRIKGSASLEVRLQDCSEIVQRAPKRYTPRVPRVLYIANSHDPKDASRVYRAELPAKALNSIGVEAKVISEKQGREMRIDRQANISEWDVVILQRIPKNKFTSDLAVNAISAGALLLYETDDLIFKPWRRSEMGVIRSGTVRADDTAYAESLERRLNMLMGCHGVIVSTPYLQRELLSLGKESIISRNALEEDMFKWGAKRLHKIPDHKQELKLLFMSGSPTHIRDLKTIEQQIYSVLTSYPNVSLTLLGEVGNTHLSRLQNVKKIPRVSRDEMLQIVTDHDVVLVPLERTGFNIGKSSLKFMECAAAGVPIIASAVYEFKRDLLTCKGGIVCKSPTDWTNALRRFVENPSLSYEMGELSYRYAASNYSLPARGQHLWNEIVRFDEYLSDKRCKTNHVLAKLVAKMNSGDVA